MNIFVSREIKQDSPFNDLPKNVHVTGKSLLRISAVDFNQIPESLWIFFYSSNGVKYFYEGLQRLNLTLNENVKIGTIGEGTAKVYKKYFGENADFIGNGSKEKSILFFEKCEGPILFVKGSNSIESVERHLPQEKIKELIVYENELDLGIEIPESDIYVLTSPMNVEVYMKKACCRFNTKIIAIGPTTNQALIAHGFLLASVPDTPSENAIVKLINTMIDAK